MLVELIQNSFVAVVIVLFLCLFILTNNNFEKRTNRLFLAAAICVLILIVEEAWEAQLALKADYDPMRVVLSAIGYSLRPVIPCLLAFVVKSNPRSWQVFLSIPLAVNTLISFSALFCGVTFAYTPDNQFLRGPLGFTPFFVAGFYVVTVLILTIQECRNGGLMEAMIISAIVLLAFLSTILESIFRVRFIQNPSIATSITFYYLFLHSSQSNRDPLTGALIRRRFYLDAEKYHSALSAVISLDLNNLKELNDQYGHTEGDKALIAITDVVKKHTGAKASLYRVGGDEFMILCYRQREKDVCKLISSISADLEKTKYRCAIGYAMHSDKMDFDNVCQLADNVMYENKRQMKAANSQSKES